MTQHTPSFRLSGLALAVAVMISACGGGDAGPPPEAVPPTMNVTSSASGTAVGAVTFTFTLSEDVGASFTADDVAVTNGSKGAFAKLSATQYTLAVTPAANSNGSIAVTVAAGSFEDLVGNKVAGASTLSQAFDTRPPAVTATSSAAGTTASGDVTFSFSFSKDVGTSFTTDDIAVTGGTKGAFTRTSGTSATLVVGVAANSSGSISVSVPVGAVADSGGTTNSAAASVAQAFNTVIPVVTTRLVSFDEATAPKLIGFGGAEDATVVADPTAAGNKVGKVIKSATAELWAGATMAICPSDAIVALPFSATNTRLSARVWAADAGIPVRLKVENAADGTKSVETEATTTVASGWQTLTFNFANQAAGTAALNLATVYNKASIFFNFGKTGVQAGGAKTYYVDDLSFVGSTFTVACPPTGGGGGATVAGVISFDETTAPVLTGFGGAEDASIAADPSNAANKVAKVIKSATAELWAGVTVSTLAAQALPAIAFSAGNTTITARVWAADAGIPVRMKVENSSNGGVSVETEATTTVAAGWQTLSFNFANHAAGTAALNMASVYNKLSMFFNFGKTGAQAGGAKTYYFEEVRYTPAATGGGGVGPGQTALVGGVYASNYTDAPTPWKSTQGGTAGRYIDNSVVTADWWSGVAVADATPSFYFGYGINTAAKPWGFGAFVNAPGNGTASVAGYTNLRMAVWGNDQLVNKSPRPNFTVILKGPTVAGCASEVKGNIAVTGAGVQNYTLPLSGFTLQTACAYASVAAALAAGVNEIHVQVLGANMQFSSGGDAGGLFPNGLNIGPISFN